MFDQFYLEIPHPEECRCCSFNYDEPVPIHSHILHSVHIMWHCHYISHFSTVAILLLGSACVLLIDPVRGFLEDSEYGEGVEGDAVKDEEDSEGDDDKEDDEQEELKPSAASMSSQQALTGTRGYSTTRLFSSLPYPTRKILLLDRVVE